MNTFPTHPPAERLRLCEAAAGILGLQAASIEKDFWVCWTLRELFALSDLGAQLTFKGGTSLSKCWKLIQRFSEDIDVVIDRHALGFEGDHAAENAGSQKERTRRLDRLKVACQTIIRDRLHPALENRFRDKLIPNLDWKITADPDDKDLQTLLFEYPSVFSAGGYLRPAVKIELGARSDTEPSVAPPRAALPCGSASRRV